MSPAIPQEASGRPGHPNRRLHTPPSAHPYPLLHTCLLYPEQPDQVRVLDYPAQNQHPVPTPGGDRRSHRPPHPLIKPEPQTHQIQASHHRQQHHHQRQPKPSRRPQSASTQASQPHKAPDSKTDRYTQSHKPAAASSGNPVSHPQVPAAPRQVKHPQAAAPPPAHTIPLLRGRRGRGCLVSQKKNPTSKHTAPSPPAAQGTMSRRHAHPGPIQDIQPGCEGDAKDRVKM